MLSTTAGRPDRYRTQCRRELLVLPAELGRVDALLDDAGFFNPFRPHFHLTFDRSSIPMRTRTGAQPICGRPACTGSEGSTRSGASRRRKCRSTRPCSTSPVEGVPPSSSPVARTGVPNWYCGRPSGP